MGSDEITGFLAFYQSAMAEYRKKITFSVHTRRGAHRVKKKKTESHSYDIRVKLQGNRTATFIRAKYFALLLVFPPFETTRTLDVRKVRLRKSL